MRRDVLRMKWRINPYARLFQYRAFVSVIPVQWIISQYFLLFPLIRNASGRQRNVTTILTWTRCRYKELNRFKRKEPLRAE